MVIQTIKIFVMKFEVMESSMLILLQTETMEILLMGMAEAMIALLNVDILVMVDHHHHLMSVNQSVVMAFC